MLPNATEQQFADALVGTSVETIDRRGKLLLIGFDSGAWIAIHRKMSGNLLVLPTTADLHKHTHFIATLDTDTDLRFVDARKFGRVYLFVSRADMDLYVDQRLGPEPLAEFTPASLVKLLQGRRGRIKAL